MTPIKNTDLHFYFIDLSNRYEAENYLADLSEEELKKSSELMTETLKSNFVIRRGLIRSILARYLEIEPHLLQFKTNTYGKPFISPQQNPNRLEFNASHTGNLLLLGVSLEREIGVDVEAIKTNVDYFGIANSFFSSAEAEALKQCSEKTLPETFYLIWSRKEAFIKAIGEGLSHPLDAFSVSAALEEPTLLGIDPKLGEPCDWTVLNLPYNQKVKASCALKHDGKACHPMIQEF